MRYSVMEKEKWDGHCIKLGEPKTVGELKNILSKYDDNISFGFRNQPIQALHELRHKDEIYVVFQ